MIAPVLQSAAAPGQWIVLLTFLGVVVSVVLSVVVVVKGVEGYRGTGDSALLGLAGGILMLSGAPLLLNLALASLTGTAPTTVSVVTNLIQLLGLALILHVIYRTGR